MTSRTPHTHPWQPACSYSPPLQALQLRIRGDIALLLLVCQYLRFLRFGIAVCVLRRKRRGELRVPSLHDKTITRGRLRGGGGGSGGNGATRTWGVLCRGRGVRGWGGEGACGGRRGAAWVVVTLCRRRQTQTGAASDCACMQKINECVTICNGCDGARALWR